MSTEYRLPEGFDNPVPDPDEKRPKPWSGWSLPDSGPFDKEKLLKGIGGLIAVVFIFSGTIFDLAEKPIRQGVYSAQEWAGVNLIADPDGVIKLEDSTVTARYTPASGQDVTEGAYDGNGFTGSQWILTEDDEGITLRDYRFDNSPVENEDTSLAYYKASAKEVNKRAGHKVEIDPIRVDGRRGMVWRSAVDGGGWLLLAEFPGDPSTVRLGCSTLSEASVVAKQCEEVLGSLQFGE